MQSGPEWVAWTIEAAGFTVTLQAWDFMPGNNFALAMQKAATNAECTIALLSPAYLKSRFGSAEWAAAFAQDPAGLERKLIPIRIRECSTDGLLKTVVCIDIVGVDEAIARKRAGISRGGAVEIDEDPSSPAPSTIRHSVTFDTA
jgi:hypothetical protein